MQLHLKLLNNFSISEVRGRQVPIQASQIMALLDCQTLPGSTRIGPDMGRSRLRWLPLLIVCCAPRCVASDRESTPQDPLGWFYVADHSQELFSRPGQQKSTVTELSKGMLVAVFKTTEKHGAQWAEVRYLDLATATPRTGWLEVGDAKILPLESYPLDSALVAQFDQPFVEDSAALHTHVQ